MQAKSIILFVSIIKLPLMTAVHLQSVFLRSEDWTVIKRIAAASHVFCFFLNHFIALSRVASIAASV